MLKELQGLGEREDIEEEKMTQCLLYRFCEHRDGGQALGQEGTTNNGFSSWDQMGLFQRAVIMLIKNNNELSAWVGGRRKDTGHI